MPQIQNFNMPYMVTLTVQNVQDFQIKAAIKYINIVFRECYLKLYNLARTKRGIKKMQIPKLQGLKKIECTYNLEKDSYHPHLHVIIDGYYQARFYTTIG